MDNGSLADLLDHHWLANWYFNVECHPSGDDLAKGIVTLALVVFPVVP